MHRSFQLIRQIGRGKHVARLVRVQSSRTYVSRCLGSHVFRSRPQINGAEHGTIWKISVPKHAYCTGSLPSHFKIALPALSPTMEKGSLVRWTKEEGDQLSEGDLLAEIETDKATMGFETPEEGYLAKILVSAGSKDVPVGQLLCIIVEEESDVAAFKNFVATEADNLTFGADAPSEAPAPAAAPTSAPTAAPTSYPSHILVNLPALSPTMERGSIKSWEVKQGDSVAEGDLLAEIETDKASVGMESSDEGYVAKIIVAAGTKDILLGTQLCILVAEESDIAAFKDYTPPAAVKEAPAAPSPPAQAPPTPMSAAPAPAAPVAAPVAVARQSGERIMASPYAKKLASERGIDLSLVQGTGPDGTIRSVDIENFVPPAVSAAPASPAAPAMAPATPGATYMDIPLTNVRQVIAKRLLESKTTIPHYYLTVECQMDNIIKLRKELNVLLEKENVKLSVNDFVIKAAALACKKVPEANSSWQDSFIRQFNTVDMSIAVATDNGLITPIVTGAEKKGLASINQDVQALAALARENKLQPHQYQGGTFTISNLGMFGVKNFSAIINPPQACILAVGGSEQRLIPDSDNQKGYRTASVMSVTMSCDHRVVDGAVGAQWLQYFKRYLEKPHTMLL